MDDRERHKAIIEANKADDATAIRVYRVIARNVREEGLRVGLPSVIEGLCDRLEAAQAEIARLRSAIEFALPSIELEITAQERLSDIQKLGKTNWVAIAEDLRKAIDKADRSS